jgi:hypothetical protein
MEELKELLSKVDTVSSKNEIESVFSKIAEDLMLKTEIKIGKDIRYTLEEIEFYYYKKGVFEEEYNLCTYPRDCNAGDFFWHYSGVDICFKSFDDAFGGILIRSLRKKVGNTDEGLIGGPMRCAIDLANCCVKKGESIKLKIHEQKIRDKTPSKTIRQGIKADYGELLDDNKTTIRPKPVVNYCYYISQDKDWNRSRDNAYVLVEDKVTKKKSYVKKSKTDYYKDNPEKRMDNIQKALNKTNNNK